MLGSFPVELNNCDSKRESRDTKTEWIELNVHDDSMVEAVKCIGDALDTVRKPRSRKIVCSDMDLESPSTGEDVSWGLLVEEKRCISILRPTYVAMRSYCHRCFLQTWPCEIGAFCPGLTTHQ
jgi:hypothetical protein